jgi:serine/threonine protein kinase
LAKELQAKLRIPDGTYKLTGATGSPRYMAPEVANSQPYNEKCDVYSFAILLWEMMALKRPYLLYTPKSLREHVYNGEHKRPVVAVTWPNAIKICLKRSWGADLHQRNSMEQVTAILRKECVAIRQGDESGLEHSRRRSTFVFRPTNRGPAVAAANKARRFSDKSTGSKEPSKELTLTQTERTVVENPEPVTDHETTEVEC